MRNLTIFFSWLLMLLLGCKKTNVDLSFVPIPLEPSNVISSVKDFKTITISWADNADNETAYILIRTVNGIGTTISLPANTTSYDDSVASPDFAYSYQVAAKNSGGISKYVSAQNGSVVALKSPVFSPFTSTKIYPDSIVVISKLDNPNDTAATCGFYWIDQNAPNSASFSITVNDGITAKSYKSGDIFTTTILTKPNTTYKIASYATNRKLNNTDTRTYSTPIKTVPVITAYPSFINYGINASVLLDSITNDGFSAVTARGIVWSYSPNPVLPANAVFTSIFKASTTIKPPSFPTATTVYIREYATNSLGTGYGPTAILRTPVPLSSAAIGDICDDGVLFYLLKPGDIGYDPLVKHGLIAAIPISKPPFYGSISNWGTTTIVGTDTALFTGENNTQLISAALGGNNYGAVPFIKNPTYWLGNNWFLPSKAELSLLVTNLENSNPFYLELMINSFQFNDSYTSSEVTPSRDSVWVLPLRKPFSTATMSPVSKRLSFINTFAIPIKRF